MDVIRAILDGIAIAAIFNGIPGTEGHPDYEFGNWMKHLAIMEHFVLTPFLMIPFVAAIQALIVGLSGR